MSPAALCTQPLGLLPQFRAEPQLEAGAGPQTSWLGPVLRGKDQSQTWKKEQEKGRGKGLRTQTPWRGAQARGRNGGASSPCCHCPVSGLQAEKATEPSCPVVPFPRATPDTARYPRHKVKGQGASLTSPSLFPRLQREGSEIPVLQPSLAHSAGTAPGPRMDTAAHTAQTSAIWIFFLGIWERLVVSRAVNASLCALSGPSPARS